MKRVVFAAAVAALSFGFVAEAALPKDASAMVMADGHAVTSGDNGGGGGGRVLIAQRLTAAQVDALYETGALPARPETLVVELTDDNVADYVPGKITAKGGVNSSQANKSGTDGSVRWLEGPEWGFRIIVR